MKKGWVKKTLGDVCQFRGGGTPSKTVERYWRGDIPWVSPKDMKFEVVSDSIDHISEEAIENSATSLIPKNSVLMVVRSGILARTVPIAITGRNLTINQDLKALCPNGAIDTRFLYRLLDSKMDVLLSMVSRGATVHRLMTEQVRSLDFALPPLPEQQRIVAILDEAFDNIAIAKANAEKNLQNARDLFENILNVVIQGKLIPQNSGDDPVTDLISQLEQLRSIAINQGKAKPEKPNQIECKDRWPFELPSSWEWTRLECLTVGISDGVHKKPEYAAEGIPFITVKNLTAGTGICFDDLNYITRADHEDFIKRTHPEKGDILITKDGTIGVVRLIETDIEFSIFVSVALIKPILRELGPYLVYALRSSCVQNQIVRKGAALKHLYLIDLRKLAIPLPPLFEQRRIVARLDALSAETQHLASLYQQKLTALDELKKSLLHQAFTGQLTVDSGQLTAKEHTP